MRYNLCTKRRAITKLTEVPRWDLDAGNEFQDKTHRVGANHRRMELPITRKEFPTQSSLLYLQNVHLRQCQQTLVSAQTGLAPAGKITQCAVDFVANKNIGPSGGRLGEGQGQRPRERKAKAAKEARAEMVDSTRGGALSRAEARAEGQNQLAARITSGIRWILQQSLELRSHVERLLATWTRVKSTSRVNAIDGKGPQPTSTQDTNTTASSKGAENSNSKGTENSSHSLSRNRWTPQHKGQIQNLSEDIPWSQMLYDGRMNRWLSALDDGRSMILNRSAVG